MKKAILIAVFVLAALVAIAIACWVERAAVAAHLLSRHLGVPVSIETLEITKENAQISHLWIGNPSGFKDKDAFTAQTIEVDSTYSQITGNPLIIDRIAMSNLNIYLENNKNGETNWTRILKHSDSKKPSNRHYLIKTLTLQNLTVQVTQPNGKVKRYPTIPSMEFHNISDETGFPINEIEKAIFNQMIKNLYQQFDIQNLLQQAIPGGNYIPKLPFFN